MINEIRPPLAMCNCIWQIYIKMCDDLISTHAYILSGNVVLIMSVCILLYFVKFQLWDYCLSLLIVIVFSLLIAMFNNG